MTERAKPVPKVEPRLTRAEIAAYNQRARQSRGYSESKPTVDLAALKAAHRARRERG